MNSEEADVGVRPLSFADCQAAGQKRPSDRSDYKSWLSPFSYLFKSSGYDSDRNQDLGPHQHLSMKLGGPAGGRSIYWLYEHLQREDFCNWILVKCFENSFTKILFIQSTAVIDNNFSFFIA